MMLSNHLIGNHKFVLFIDEVGMEQNCLTILENLLQENNVNFEKNVDENCEINEKLSIVLSPFSKLSLKYNEENLFKLVQRFKINDKVNQIFGWATSKNINSAILIPFLEHMSDITVTIKSKSHLIILTKKKFGNVKLKEYQHDLVNGKTNLSEISQKNIPQETIKIEDPEVIGTFKIGQFKNDELEAKRNMKLPFEIM